MNTAFNEPIISLEQSEKDSTIYDILIHHCDELAEAYKAIEFDMHFYPVERKIRETNYTVRPFKEYESQKNKFHSPYKKIRDPMAWINGVLASIGVASGSISGGIENILGVEEMFTEAAAFFAGYKWRPEIEPFITSRSRKYPVRRKEIEYNWKLQLWSTQVRYANYVKHQRNLVDTLMPESFMYQSDWADFSLKMKFLSKAISSVLKDNDVWENSINIGTIEFDNLESVKQLKDKWYQLGVVFKGTHREALSTKNILLEHLRKRLWWLVSVKDIVKQTLFMGQDKQHMWIILPGDNTPTYNQLVIGRSANIANRLFIKLQEQYAEWNIFAENKQRKLLDDQQMATVNYQYYTTTSR